MNELVKQVEQWAIDRNLHTAQPIKQYDKLIEEFGELVQGLNKNNIELIKDSIGDMYVVLVVMFTQLELDLPIQDNVNTTTDTVSYITNLSEIGKALEKGNNLLVKISVDGLLKKMKLTCIEKQIGFEECVQIAYNEIRHRKGRMVNGVFVKESDMK